MNSPIRRDFYVWRPAAVLKISGEDASRFLQGQFTNDLQKGKSGEAVYGLWLNQKGKVLADSFILQQPPGTYWIVSYFSPAMAIRERLEAYIIADDVIVEDLTEGMKGFTWFGDASGVDTLPLGALVFPGRRSRELHGEIVCPLEDAAALTVVFAQHAEVAGGEMERRRIDAGIPAVPADIGPGELPNEGGLETEAISYTKGCYLGQEVMARLKSMGQVRRRLVRVQGRATPPALPTPLYQAGRKVGELRSLAADASGWTGLALVSLLQVQRAEGVSTAPDRAPDIFLSERS